MSKMSVTAMRMASAAILLVVLSGIYGVSVVVQAAPPENQTFVGNKKCASCHFEQYMTWKKTKHAKTFDDLPAKYKTEVGCLKCHTTGYGAATGFKDAGTTPELAGNGCETCHGPGSEHVKISQALGNKKLTDEEKATAKASIWRIRTNVCMECHMAVTHRAHERFDKE